MNDPGREFLLVGQPQSQSDGLFSLGGWDDAFGDFFVRYIHLTHRLVVQLIGVVVQRVYRLVQHIAFFRGQRGGLFLRDLLVDALSHSFKSLSYPDDILAHAF